jgi:cbb3-type cytochrome oxidase subunit 3
LRYSFQAKTNVNYQYDYDVTAKVIATDGDSTDKVLYESEEVLVPAKRLSGNTGEFFINESINIDYGKYNSLITAFRSDYGLTLKANVIVTLNVHLVGEADGFAEVIKSDQRVALNIPLSERTINVSLNSDEINNEGSLEEKARDFAKNLPWIIVADISAIVFLSILIISIVIFVFRESRRSDYDKELSHIMKEYGQIIVKVDRLPETPAGHVVEVGDFDELLNVHDTVEKPIIYKELVQNHCSIFMIEDSETVYTYIIGVHNSAILAKAHKASRR